MAAHDFTSIRELRAFTRTKEYDQATEIGLTGQPAQELSKAMYELKKVKSAGLTSSVASAGGVVAATAAIFAGIAAAPVLIAGAVMAVTVAEVNKMTNKRREENFENGFPWGDSAIELREDGWNITKNYGDKIVLSRS